MEDTEKFLKELTSLSEKYGVYIGGCGCCGSPYVYSDQYKIHDIIGESLCYEKDLKKYTIENKFDFLLD